MRKGTAATSICKLLEFFAAVLSWSSVVNGLDIDVLTCADIQKVNAALAEDHITARFANLTCEPWVTIVAQEPAGSERELRIEALPDADGQPAGLHLTGVRFDMGRGMTVTFTPDVHFSRPSYYFQGTDGGALNAHDASSVIFLGDVLLEHIRVQGSGAGMYIANDASVHVHGRATFNQLESKKNGGAVCTTSGGILVAFGGITATKNMANNGGALYNFGHIHVENEKSDFTGNSARRGAALYNGEGAKGVEFFAEAIFENNQAFETGGEAAMFSGENIYSKSYVLFNADATFVGGHTAIFVDGGLVEMKGATDFSNFTAGAVYTTYEPLYTNLKFTENPEFQNNSGGAGGCGTVAQEQLEPGHFLCGLTHANM